MMGIEALIEAPQQPKSEATPKRVIRQSSAYALGFKLITRRSQVQILTPLLEKNIVAQRL
jgi:hypothetical protein